MKVKHVQGLLPRPGTKQKLPPVNKLILPNVAGGVSGLPRRQPWAQLSCASCTALPNHLSCTEKRCRVCLHPLQGQATKSSGQWLTAMTEAELLHCLIWNTLDLQENSPFSILVLQQRFIPCKSVTMNLPPTVWLQDWDEKCRVYILSCFKRSREKKAELQRWQKKGTTYHGDSIPNYQLKEGLKLKSCDIFIFSNILFRGSGTLLYF